MERPFTKKQLAIIELLWEKKKAEGQGYMFLTLDEIIDRLGEKGMPTTRQSAIISMNILVPRLNSTGIGIRKMSIMGRGRKMEYRL